MTKEIPHIALAGRARRDLPLELCDLKFEERTDESKPVRFEGYGSVWGRVDAYGDTVVKGAFVDSLKSRRPMMLYGHSPGRVPGKWISYTEDDKGLKLTGELTPGHSEATDIAASLKHGSLNGLSIGGYTQKSEPLDGGGRLIHAFDLYEVSVCSMPAEQEARIDTQSVKCLVDQAHSIKDFEEILRESGFSKTAATYWMSRLIAFVRGDPEAKTRMSQVAGETLETLRSLKIPSSILE